MSNTIRVVKTGTIAKVFLPDGSQLLKVLDASVSIEQGGFGRLTLVLSDFIIDSSIDDREKPDAEVTSTT